MKKRIIFLALITTILFNSCSKDKEVATADPIQQQLISEILSAGNSITNDIATYSTTVTPTNQLKSTANSLPNIDISKVVNSLYSGKITITGTMSITSTTNSVSLNLILKEVFADYLFKVNDVSYKTNGTINYATVFTSSGSGSGQYKSTISGSINIAGTNYNKTCSLELTVVADANNKGTVSGTIDGVAISYTK